MATTIPRIRKVELHQHVDGSIPPRTIWRLMKGHGLTPVPTLREMRRHLQLQKDEEGSLLAYLDSVGRMHRLEVDLVLPGHGPPFSGHREVIDRLVQFYAKRQARIREALAEEPRTAWALSRVLFPWAKPSDAFLTVSETIANLEVLEARGEVARALEGDVYRFRTAP